MHPVYYPKSHIAPAARLYSSMQIDLTEEQKLLRETCREFAEKELRPNARRWDREHQYPADAVKKAFELGLGGVAVPAEWGGAGMDNVAYALAIEEISRGCASVGVTLSVNNSLYCDPVLRYGTDRQKESWLKPFASGEKLGCFGLTEPQAGSDAAEQRTTAVPRGDKYVINGTQNWITNGPVADAIVLFTITDLSKGTQAIQFMLADMTTELEAARLLTLRAASLKDAGVRHSRESSMAKLYASEAANRVADKAVQIHGGMGYSKELDVERHFRDARITEIYEGTSEIQRLVISNALLK